MSPDSSTVADPHLNSLEVLGDTDTFPPHAELVRTLLSSGRFATLTTLTSPMSATHAEPGSPYGSLVGYSVLTNGSPLVCISDLAEHTRNARADDRAGMLLTGLAVDADCDPLDRPRVSLVGRLVPVIPGDDDVVAHQAIHAGTADYARFPDFSWWCLTVSAARFIGGFGHMSWVSGDDLARAEPDPVLADAQGAVDHMNHDHADALIDMIRWLAGVADVTAARVHSIDRRGMTLYAQRAGAEPLTTVRLAFDAGPLGDSSDIRGAVVALTRRARLRAEDGR